MNEKTDIREKPQIQIGNQGFVENIENIYNSTIFSLYFSAIT